VLLANPLHPFHDVFFRIAKSFPAGNWFVFIINAENVFIINAENDTENEFVQSSAQKTFLAACRFSYLSLRMKNIWFRCCRLIYSDRGCIIQGQICGVPALRLWSTASDSSISSGHAGCMLNGNASESRPRKVS